MNALFSQTSLKMVITLISLHTLFACGWEIPWVDKNKNPSPKSSGDYTNLEDDWHTPCTLKTSGGAERIKYEFTTEIYESDFLKVKRIPRKYEKNDCSDVGEEESEGTPFGYQKPTHSLTLPEGYSQVGLLIFKDYRDEGLTYTCFEINSKKQMLWSEFKKEPFLPTTTSCNTTGADSDKENPRLFTAL